jgi:hypothetical protein
MFDSVQVELMRPSVILLSAIFLYSSSIALAEDNGAKPAKWIKLAEDNGVVVEIRKNRKGETLVRGTKKFRYSLKQVRENLIKVSSFSDWLPNTDVWQVLKEGESEVFVYARHALSWPMSDRDYRVRYTWQDFPDGRFRVTARSSTKLGPPPIEGVIRLKNVYSVFTATPKGDATCELEYRYEGSLGGDLPEFIIRSAWKKEPPTVLMALERWMNATIGAEASP